MTTAHPSGAQRPRSILFCHGSDEAYGADRILLGIVRGFRDRGYRVTVLLPDDTPPGWLSERLVEAGIPVERGPLAVARRRYLGLSSLPRYAALLVRARRWIRAAARRAGADIVHVNTSALLVGAILGRPGGARLVWHVHEIVVRPFAMAALFRLVPPVTADRVIAVSDAVRSHLTPRGFRATRVVTVRNGLPARPDPVSGQAIALTSTSGPTVAFVGRLNRWKGAEVFVDAIALCAARVPGARFVIAGDAPPGEEWRAAAIAERLRELGIEHRVDLLGFVPDGAAVFESAQVAVVPSTWPEPFGMVILEAMRASCAVIATNHGGAAEVVVDGATGVLVPPGDPVAIADAIVELVVDGARRRRMGQAGRHRVATEFSVGRSLDGIEDVYRALDE